MTPKPPDIITEKQLKKWWGLSDYQMMVLRPKLPKYELTRELRLYNRQSLIEFLCSLPSIVTESSMN